MLDETTQFEFIPGSHRATDRVKNLLRRVPLMAWPFIALAGLRWLVFIVASGGHWDIWTFLVIVDVTAWALLPAAVIIGRPDAWRSARAVLLGAIAWSTIGAVSSLIWGWGAVSGGGDSFSDARLSVSLVEEIVGLAAPLVIVYDLSFRRRTTTSWPPLVIVLAVAGTAAALWWTTSTALDWYNSQLGIGAALPDEPARQLLFLGQILAPLALLSLGVIAWSSMSAVRADEQARRFWTALTAGSTALLAIHIYAHVVSWVMPTAGYSQTVVDWCLITTHIEELVAVAAIALLLLAFGFGVPKVVDPDEVDIALESGDPDPAVSTEPGAPGDLPA
jgi:hypothetical protein